MYTRTDCGVICCQQMVIHSYNTLSFVSTKIKDLNKRNNSHVQCLKNRSLVFNEARVNQKPNLSYTTTILLKTKTLSRE